eukprot:SAG31_NODE_4358_length_3313_cov_2.599876_3_plen_64_part_00
MLRRPGCCDSRPQTWSGCSRPEPEWGKENETLSRETCELVDKHWCVDNQTRLSWQSIYSTKIQ